MLEPAAPSASTRGLPCDSKVPASTALPAQRIAIAAKTAQPCFVFPTRRPYAYARENGIRRSAKISSRLVNGVGFESGCAEFALSVPPPFVPSSLIASWLANGPPGIDCVAPSSVRASVNPSRLWIAPRATSTSASTIARGRRIRVTARVRSAQKLPIVSLRRRVIPRTSAIATAIPTAAETKFCTASPLICVRWLIVDSPA